MANTYATKILEATTSLVTLYTVPALKTSIIQSIIVTNIDGAAAADITISIYDDFSAGTFVLADAETIQANSHVELLDRNMVLNSDDLLKILASANGDLNVRVSYLEMDD